MLMSKPEFPVRCPNAQEKYGDKTAMFRVELDGELRALTGKFIIYQTEEGLYIDVEHVGQLQKVEPPNTLGYSFHLSQAHVDSIIPANVPGLKVDFEIQIPFLANHRAQKPSDRRPLF